MRGNYATGVLVIMTAMLVIAVLTSYILVKTAEGLEYRADLARGSLDCVLSAAQSGEDPSYCLSDLNLSGVNSVASER